MPLMNNLRNLKRSVVRGLGKTPMRRVMKELELRGVRLGDLDAVELFGRAGDYHTLDYSHRVKSLEVWELDESYREPLRKNLPKARIEIVDTYEQVKRIDRQFGLIVCDNPIFIHGGHCENFDLFPGIYRVAADRAVLIIDVVPFVGPAELYQFPNLAKPDHRAARAAFHGCDDPMNIPLDQIERTYRAHAEASGFRVDWTFLTQRNKTAIHYFVQHVTRVGSSAAGT